MSGKTTFLIVGENCGRSKYHEVCVPKDMDVQGLRLPVGLAGARSGLTYALWTCIMRLRPLHFDNQLSRNGTRYSMTLAHGDVCTSAGAEAQYQAD